MAEASLQGEWVIVGTDIKNAFGSMHRSGAIGAVARCCPPLAGLLASSWCQGTRQWAGTSDTGWAQCTSLRGGAQGDVVGAFNVAIGSVAGSRAVTSAFT